MVVNSNVDRCHQRKYEHTDSQAMPISCYVGVFLPSTFLPSTLPTTTLGHNYISTTTLGHNYISTTTLGHNFISTTTSGHNYISTTTLGHNYFVCLFGAPRRAAPSCLRRRLRRPVWGRLRLLTRFGPIRQLHSHRRLGFGLGHRCRITETKADAGHRPWLYGP